MFQDICLFIYLSICCVGDLIKYICYTQYLLNDSNAVFIYVYLSLCTVVVISRIIYQYNEITFQYFRPSQHRLYLILCISWCFEICCIIPVVKTTTLFEMSGMVLASLYSIIMTFGVIRYHFKTYWLGRRHRIFPLFFPKTTFPIEEHTCIDTDTCAICPCVICFDTIDFTVSLSCTHQFHHSCFVKWIQTQRGSNITCPMCRSFV
jgi:hypothetical protein